MPSLQSWNMRHPGSTFLCVPLRGLSRTGPQRPRILGKGRSRRVECSVAEESIHFKFRHAQRKFTWEFRTKNRAYFPKGKVNPFWPEQFGVCPSQSTRVTKLPTWHLLSNVHTSPCGMDLHRLVQWMQRSNTLQRYTQIWPPCPGKKWVLYTRVFLVSSTPK